MNLSRIYEHATNLGSYKLPAALATALGITACGSVNSGSPFPTTTPVYTAKCQDFETGKPIEAQFSNVEDAKALAGNCGKTGLAAYAIKLEYENIIKPWMESTLVSDDKREKRKLTDYLTGLVSKYKNPGEAFLTLQQEFEKDGKDAKKYATDGIISDLKVATTKVYNVDGTPNKNEIDKVLLVVKHGVEGIVTPSEATAIVASFFGEHPVAMNIGEINGITVWFTTHVTINDLENYRSLQKEVEDFKKSELKSQQLSFVPASALNEQKIHAAVGGALDAHNAGKPPIITLG